MNRVELPDKLYFKIGEVAKIVGVKQHVLRYWESEFPWIKPQKTKSNQRLYRRRDVEAALAVKHLLYDRKFTIEGARNHLKQQGAEASMPPQDPLKIAEIAKEEALQEIETAVLAAKSEVQDRFHRELMDLRDQLLAFKDRMETD